MFNSLFQLEQKPVKVYSSSDKNAPVLTEAAGSLKTLLKACLVTGYGDKSPLGFQMKFESEDKNSAVFVSSNVRSSGYHLKVNNSQKVVKLSCYQNMSSIDDGEKPTVVDRNYHPKTSEWRLVGHDTAFVLLLDITPTNFTDKISLPLLFGDLPRQLKRQVAPCVLWCGFNSISSHNQSIGGVQSTLFYKPNGYSNYTSSRGVDSALCYPFVVNNGQAGMNITNSYCRFTHASQSPSSLLHEPILFSLPDGTWSFLPMLQPLSKRAVETNLALITENCLLARTGISDHSSNNHDCIVPIDWWWA